MRSHPDLQDLHRAGSPFLLSAPASVSAVLAATGRPHALRAPARVQSLVALPSRQTSADNSTSLARGVPARQHALMAVLLQLSVSAADREQFDQLDVRVGNAMVQAGGPPPGLMSHVVYPQGEGFVIAQVWRTQADAQSYLDDSFRSLVAELELTDTTTTFLPVWSFARP